MADIERALIFSLHCSQEVQAVWSSFIAGMGPGHMLSGA